MRRRLYLWLRKVWAVFSIYFQDSLAYRGQAVIWILTDVVPALVMPLVWLSAYNGRSAIGGKAAWWIRVVHPSIVPPSTL